MLVCGLSIGPSPHNLRPVPSLFALILTDAFYSIPLPLLLHLALMAFLPSSSCYQIQHSVPLSLGFYPLHTQLFIVRYWILCSVLFLYYHVPCFKGPQTLCPPFLCPYLPHCLQVIVGRNQSGRRGSLGDTWRVGKTQGGDTTASLAPDGTQPQVEPTNQSTREVDHTDRVRV